MDKKTMSLILKALKNAISIVLAIAATFSMLGATLINVARDYLQSEQFINQIEETDLGQVKFAIGGETVTVNEYARSKVADYLKDKMPSFFPFQNYAVDAIVTSEKVNSAVKSEIFRLIDYFLNTDVEEAKYRLENNITLEANEDLNPEKATTIEEAISIYARGFALRSLENAIGMSSDKVIILASEETVSKLITLAVVLLIVLVVINLRTIFNNLLYGGIIGILYGAVIKISQSKFDEWNKGAEDLVGYVFLKPLAEEYSSNATIGFVVGIILLAMFVGVYFLFKNIVNTDKVQEN